MASARHKHVSIPIIIAVLSLLLGGLAPALGLEDGRIGVLHIGAMDRREPFWYMRTDPLFPTTFILTTLQHAPASETKRMVRLYMPRNQQHLTSKFDVIVMSHANVYGVGGHDAKLARGVEEGGLGLFMGGGWESFGSHAGNPPWDETAIGRLLPVNSIPGTFEGAVVQRVVIERPGHELTSSLPWNWDDPGLGSIKWPHNIVYLKPGAGQLAHVVVPSEGRRDPLMITWERDSGARVFAYTAEIYRLNMANWYWGEVWEYSYDLAANLMIYLDRRPVPQDVELVHAARNKIFEVATRRSLLMVLMDFCDAFGANTQSMMPMFEEMDEKISRAMPQYLELRFQEMLETYTTVEAMLEKAEKEAVKLKNQALLWVYVIEYLAVTGTAMLVGFILWSLMIQRRLYKEVKTIRFV